MTNERPDVSLEGTYSISEASLKLGVTRKSMYKYIRDGNVHVHYRKINKLPFIYGKDIIKLWGSRI